MLKEVGVSARVWVQPGLGHDIPSEKVLVEAIRWLDEQAPRRKDEAKRQPASRVAGDAAPGREEQARALFSEAKKRLDRRDTLYSGLMQLQGVMQRWPDLPIGADAKRILVEYDSRAERPWDMEDLAEQRRFLIAQARRWMRMRPAICLRSMPKNARTRCARRSNYGRRYLPTVRTRRPAARRTNASPPWKRSPRRRSDPVHAPVQFGRRFSRNAHIPSCASRRTAFAVITSLARS